MHTLVLTDTECPEIERVALFLNANSYQKNSPVGDGRHLVQGACQCLSINLRCVHTQTKCIYELHGES